ncbi:MAG: hypothetical protein QXU73_07635 [Thermoplasmata archaeon]
MEAADKDGQSRQKEQLVTVKSLGAAFIVVGLVLAGITGGLVGLIGVGVSLVGYYTIVHEKQIIEQVKQ